MKGLFIKFKHNLLKSGHTETGPYVDNARRPDARFRVNDSQEDVGTIDAAHTGELQSLGVLFSLIAFGKWDFRVMGAPGHL